MNVTIFGLYRNHTQSGASASAVVGALLLITNGNGRETEVQGEGVVGVQPLIAPGEEYQYTSGAIIEIPAGHHAGSLRNDR